MVSPAAGKVVLVRFPFSDLSAAKLRPAIVLAATGRDDWVLCQITSNPYTDALAIRIEETDFAVGSLQKASYARPGKLFTANAALMVSDLGTLKEGCLKNVVASVVRLLQGGRS